MNILDTISLMQSKEYKDRAKAEYYQLKIRWNNLQALLVKYREGTLGFTPNCPYDLLHAQLVYMKGYLSILEERIKLGDFEL